MCIPWLVINKYHPDTTLCARRGGKEASESSRGRITNGSDTAFWAYGQTLATVIYFCYLGRILTTIDDDWLAVIGNIRKARQRWSNILHILGREGVDARTSGQFYLIVIQEIMFFLGDGCGKPLYWEGTGVFHHWVVSQIMGKKPWKQADITWQ